MKKQRPSLVLTTLAIQQLLLVLCILSNTMAAYTAPRIAAQQDTVTQISLQRTQCYGLCPIDTVTLNADGSASYVSVRNGLHRKGSYVGRISPEKFQSLAIWLAEQNFFGFRNEIGRGNIDSSDFIVSVQRGFGRFTVAFRGDEFHMGQKFKDALLAAVTVIKWKKEVAAKSEIKGSVSQPITPERKTTSDTMPTRFTQVIASTLELPPVNYWTITNQAGEFQFFLPPGRYSIRVDQHNEAAPHIPLSARLRHDSLVITVKEGESIFQKITLRPLR